VKNVKTISFFSAMRGEEEVQNVFRDRDPLVFRERKRERRRRSEEAKCVRESGGLRRRHRLPSTTETNQRKERGRGRGERREL
jgi:hypothetical protein